MTTQADRRRTVARWAVGLLALAFWALLTYAQVEMLGPFYRDDLHSVKDLPWYMWAASLGLSLLPLAWLRTDIDRVSEFLNWSLYIMLHVPACVVFPYQMEFSEPVVLAWMGIMTASSYVLAIPSRMPPRPLGLAATPFTYWAVVVAVLAVVVLVLGLTQGFSFELVDFKEMYDRRAEIAEKHNLLSAYLFGFLRSTLCSVVLVKAVQSRRPAMFAVLLVLILFTYSVGAEKTSVAVILLGALVLFVTYRGGEAFGLKYMLGIVGVCAIVMTIDFAQDQVKGVPFATILVMRRTFHVPAALTAKYIEFFSENPISYLSDSFLKDVVRYPYADPLALVVGEKYVGPQVWANAPYIPSAFSELGLLGVVLNVAALAWLFRFMDRASVGLPLWIPCVIVSGSTTAISNARLSTTLLSHGMGLAILLILWYPRSRTPTTVTAPAGVVEPQPEAG